MTTQTTLGPPRCPACGNELEGPLPKTTGEGAVRCTKPYCGVELLPLEDGRFRIRTYRLVDHYTLFVLPFSFAGSASDPVERLAGSDRWLERRFSLDNEADVDRTEYFLPYVKRFLFPSLQPERSPGEPTCRHFQFDLARLGALEGGRLPLSLHCTDTRKKLSLDHKIGLESAGLVVFHYRVGFLVLRFRNRDEGATYFDQMNAAVYLRAIAPLYRGFEMPTLSAGATRFPTTQLLPYLLAEFDGDRAVPSGPAQVPEKTRLPVTPIYDDRMMVYSFSCLDKNTCVPSPERCKSLLERFAIVDFTETTRPTAEEPADDLDSWTRGRWQGFSKEGGGLAVFDTDRYHERFLGDYNASYYFDIFLLATLQRVTLLSLFERLSDIPSLTTHGSESRHLMRRVRRDVLLFKNQCWFSQITNRERGLQLWKKWQETFENKALLEEVNEQSEELDEYLQARTREKVESLVRLGGFLATSVPAVLGLEVLFGAKSWVGTVRWTLLVAIVVGTGMYAGFMFFREERDK